MLVKRNSHQILRKFGNLVFFTLVAIFSGSAIQTILPFRVVFLIIALTTIMIISPVMSRLITKHWQLGDFFYLIISIMILFNLVLYPNDLTYNIYLFCLVSIAYSLTITYSYREIFRVMVVFSIFVAIAAFCGTYIINKTSIFDFLPSFLNTNGYEYKVAILFNYIPLIKDRVIGFFWEPGLLATCMTYAFVCKLAFLQFRNTFKDYLMLVFFLSCCIFTTSTAGYVLVLLCIMFFLFRKANTKTSERFKFFVRFILLALLLVAVFNIDNIIVRTGAINNQYARKLLYSNLASDTRILVVIENFKMWFKTPFFGLGLTNAQKLLTNGVYDTSTTSYLMVLYGFLGASYTLAIVFGIFQQKKLNIYQKVLLLVMLMIIVNKEPHQPILFTWILIFFLLKEKNLGELRKQSSNVLN